jgi:hypothetical protein
VTWSSLSSDSDHELGWDRRRPLGTLDGVDQGLHVVTVYRLAAIEMTSQFVDLPGLHNAEPARSTADGHCEFRGVVVSSESPTVSARPTRARCLRR